MKRIIALILALLTLGAMLAACGESKTDATEAPKATEAAVDEATADEPADASDLGYVLGKGTLIVGVTDFAPMDSKDDNGEWIGFDADMAKLFGEYLGVKVEFFEILDWDNKHNELDGKNIDCVWNGMTLTDAVKELMSTSDAYCKNEQVVIVKSDVADKYADAEACKSLKFAVENGSAGEAQAEDYGFEYTKVESQAIALMEVAAGTSDAAIIDSSMAKATVGAGTDYENLVQTVVLNSEEYGVGFRKGSDITAKFNEFWAEVLADGTVEEIAALYGIEGQIIK